MSTYTGRFPADSPIFAGRELLANRIRTHAEYYVGLDLAQVQDYTAIVIVERVEVVMPEVDRVTYQHRLETRFHLRHAERVPLGISYPDIVAHVKRVVDKAPLRGHCKLIVDATGVGAPIVELLQRGGLGCQVIAVTITPGQLESSNGNRYAVPKQDLIAGLQVAFQKKRLRVAAGIPALGALMEELKMMRSKRRESGYLEMAGRKSDDLVLALSLAWWRASREAGWGR